VWAAVCVARRIEAGGRRMGRLVVASLALAVLMTAGLHVAVHLPPSAIRSGWTYRWDPTRINTSMQAERFGWRELGEWVSRTRREMLAAQGAMPRGVFVIAHEYGLSANVAFYTPDRLHTLLWSPRKTHGENYRFWDDFPALRGQDAIFVANRESRLDKSLDKLREHFERLEPPERLPVVVQGQEVRSFYLVRCRGFDGRAPEFPRRRDGA
jgi:hypothetical protein